MRIACHQKVAHGPQFCIADCPVNAPCGVFEYRRVERPEQLPPPDERPGRDPEVRSVWYGDPIGVGLVDGVPVVLRGGKRLGRERKGVSVTFRPPEACLCPPGTHAANRVDITLEPTERIAISFWARKPGLDDELEPRTFDFLLRPRASDAEEYPKVLDGLCKLISLDMRVVDANWIGLKLRKLLNFGEQNGAWGPGKATPTHGTWCACRRCSRRTASFAKS